MANKLRDAILAKYGTEAAFAKEIGWSKQRLNKLTHGLTELRVADVKKFAKALDCPVADVVNFFDL